MNSDLEDVNNETGIPSMTAFSIMFVSIGMSCFIWQSITAGQMFYKSRKPIIGIVFSQATLGIVVTFVTLLTSLTPVDCTFRLIFSVVGVNLGDMSLQFVLLWKAYLGNNRSKVILFVGCLPILSIAVFICINITFGRSETSQGVGICDTAYPTYIVIAKAIIDCTSNTFLSGCFILVIYRHYRILGSSVQKTLIAEGLIYCFGVCFSNIVTGILLAKTVFGGSTPILYTIDWYLASYLIIQQLRHRPSQMLKNKDDDDDEEDDDSDSNDAIACMQRRNFGHSPCTPSDQKNMEQMKTNEQYSNKDRDTYYHSIDGTLVASSSSSARVANTMSLDEENMYPLPTMPAMEKRTYMSQRKDSAKTVASATESNSCCTDTTLNNSRLQHSTEPI